MLVYIVYKDMSDGFCSWSDLVKVFDNEDAALKYCREETENIKDNDVMRFRVDYEEVWSEA